MSGKWLEGIGHKFLVVKNSDIQNHLNNSDRKMLIQLLDKIQKGRAIRGEGIGHSYLIINTDEPYAPKIAEIMKDNGHWG